MTSAFQNRPHQLKLDPDTIFNTGENKRLVFHNIKIKMPIVVYLRNFSIYIHFSFCRQTTTMQHCRIFPPHGIWAVLFPITLVLAEQFGLRYCLLISENPKTRNETLTRQIIQKICAGYRADLHAVWRKSSPTANLSSISSVNTHPFHRCHIRELGSAFPHASDI